MLKVNVTSSRILEIGQDGIKTEQTGKVTITDRYRGTHWDTVEVQMNPDGTLSWQVKFIQMTDKGDMLVGTGSGTRDAPNPRYRKNEGRRYDRDCVRLVVASERQEVDMRSGQQLQRRKGAGGS